MYDQIREDSLYIMLYALVLGLAMIASCYLLFRRGNAFAPDVTPPLRLRRWAAAFFASIALNHLWYMPILFHTSSEDIVMTDLIGGLLDSMTFFPLAISVLFTMLQDRRRPLWPIAVMMAPLVAVGIFAVANRSYAPLPMVYAYFLLICIGLIVYMVRALRQYGSWLRDNYADLEHKEVWQSFVVLAIMLLSFAVYATTSKGPVYQYAMQVVCMVLIFYLLWRVETLSDLNSTAPQLHSSSSPQFPISPTPQLPKEETAVHANMGLLLQRYCIDTQLYLQHDLTLLQLAKAIGVNRFYLSKYFSDQGLNYNAYINDLRIKHFVSLYHEAVEAQRSVTPQQLAKESGYKSYSTFRGIFRQTKGLSVTAWMKEIGRGNANKL